MKFFFLALVLLLLPGMAIAGGAPKIHDTTTTVTCTPNPVSLMSPATCTATITDLGGQGPDTSPPGSVMFGSSGTGSFSATSCTVIPGPNATSSCSVTYTPTVFGTGTHTISAGFNGGSDPDPATGIIFNPSSGSAGLVLSYPALTITAISPANGNRGESVAVTVSGTGFVAGATTLILGPNITVSGLAVDSSTQLTATLTILAAAVTGQRDVTVTNPAPGGGSATLPNGFEVRNPVPVIDTLTPAAVEVGSGAMTLTVEGSGFVNDSVVHFNGAPRSTTFVNSTRLEISLTAGETAAAASYPVTVVNNGPGGGTSNTATFSVVPPGGSFDTVEPGAPLGSAMFTKLAGTAFSTDILATEISRLAVDTGFTGNVRIELLDASNDTAPLDASGCRASWNVVQVLPNQAYAAADNGRISVTTSFAGALRIARFRISYPATGTPSHVGCSSDAFSVRPQSLALSTPLTNATSSGSPMHAAGTAFSITATAIPGYDGTPQIGTLPPGTPGALNGLFTAADPASGSSTGNSFSYNETGSFVLAPGDVYDSSFTAIDQPDDCTAGLSNTLNGGKYGCDFANTVKLDVGRFIPAYFDVTVNDSCPDAGGFTYSGQPFVVTVTAHEAGGAVTQNYEGALAKDVTLSDGGNTTNFEPGTNLIDGTLFTNGIAINTVTTYRFPSAETDYSAIAVRAVDADSASSVGHLEESMQIRSGRFVIANGNAVTGDAGVAEVMLQTWRETSPGTFEWAVHADDVTCTTPGIGNFSLQFSPAGNLDAGETSIGGFFFNAGQGALTLSPPGAGNDGTVEIEGTTDSWLYFDWDDDGTRTAPLGSMTFFEIFSSEDGFIERHEVIP